MINSLIRLATPALLAAALAGCALVQDMQVPKEWEPLLADLRTFQRRVGFERFDSFLEFSAEQGAHTFCGRTPRLYLPYSYEDPAIRWVGAKTEQECRGTVDGIDAYFGTVEAIGEVGAAITTEVLGVPLHRFVYLVLHEDCHDEFALPYGIEEALCNLLAYKGMAAFSAGQYSRLTRENLTIRRYASFESQRTRSVKAIYEQLARHYERYQRGEIPAAALLQERARILEKAERVLQWKKGSLNNVGLANEITYSRHYPFLESVFEALGSDVARTIAFFKQVDAAKPSPAEVMRLHGLHSDLGADFLRAYEAEIVNVIEKRLAEP